jgi:hypothetical protein
LTAFPEPGRSSRPVLVVGLRFGMLDTVSLRFLVGLMDLMTTSSLVALLAVPDLGRELPARSRGLPGMFSLRIDGIGEPSRVGVGIEVVCLCNAALYKGVRGEILVCRCSRGAGSVCFRGVCGDHAGTSSASCKVLRSLNEERRFLRGGPTVAGTSPIVPRPPTKDRGLVLEFPFSKVNAPRTVGRSREEGRFGES